MVSEGAGLGWAQVDFTLEGFLLSAHNDIIYYLSSPVLYHVFYFQFVNEAKNQAPRPTLQKKKLKLKAVRYPAPGLPAGDRGS